ncbi:MAG: PEP-CTERM sorting domain-containing protein, partial [Akkermansia sp.]
NYSYDSCNQNLVLGGGIMTGAVKLSLTKGSSWFTSLQFAISGDTQIGGVSTSLSYSSGTPNAGKIRLVGGSCSIESPSTITAPTGGTCYTLTVKTQSSSDDYTFTGHVGEGLNLAKQGEGKQSFVGDLSKFNGDVEVKGGTLVMTSSTENSITLDDTSNTSTLKATSLSISGGATLESNLTVKVRGAFVSKAYVSDLVGTAAAATLLLGDAVGTTATTNPVASLSANTDLSDVASLNMETTVDLGGKSLTLWSGTKELTLSDSMFELQTNGTYKVTLFTNIGALSGLDSDSVSADTKFTTQQGWLSDGVTLSKVTGDNGVNLVLANIQYIPEPTTATLALLGLMGLCARRRRQK